MKKLIATLVASTLAAFSMGAFAADAAKPADTTTAAPAKDMKKHKAGHKAMHKKAAKKTEKTPA